MTVRREIVPTGQAMAGHGCEARGKSRAFDRGVLAACLWPPASRPRIGHCSRSAHE